MIRHRPAPAGSYFRGFREKRLKFFLKLIEEIDVPEISILDAGGTVLFWKGALPGFEGKIRITVMNLMRQESDEKNIIPVVGDARDMSSFKDRQFDVVFSNSVIEHVGTYEDQKRMAGEIRRVGRNYFIQTPNYYFPLEAHFLFPLFQFLPMQCKIFLLTHFNLGYYKKKHSRDDALKAIREIRLLRMSDLKELFPDSVIVKEKLFGFTKSFMAYRFDYVQAV